jgi:hypothetical protein
VSEREPVLSLYFGRMRIYLEERQHLLVTLDPFFSPP